MKDWCLWKKKFRSQPKIYWIEDVDGFPTNFYESEDAARWEWCKRRTDKVRLRWENIHSFELSKERWD